MDSYTRTISVAASPAAAYRAIIAETDRWWTPADGDASTVGAEATYRFGETCWTMRVTDLVPNERVGWECVTAYHPYDGVTKPEEWRGTRLRFDIAADGGKGARIRFEHEGLAPALDCFEICEAGWDRFFGASLKAYLDTGRGSPATEEGRSAAGQSP